ncbi:putative short-chain dehydrogenases/reductase family protein [Burkholderia multivorans]|uniref:Short-chain dehydrogenases/reductase family protein n=1 Tax=Burkholderia multivorans TaxID=87883 RepID=A0ABD7LF40_9BURK|nr:SDR family NAD(P)-dependent oxidoreductase [Burkholderia multivorans]SAK01636.1 putative short-chain dehydrogenases/reductase family protein [Burkholderia multivorans]SAK03099.1 putative short-chain dehydrogenases/reductase family protein [Burkholderia multivorans]HEF5154798.1 SDR family NAD(P)-dependent oxidoreductase [Burkholderia multivorans]
MRLEDLRGRIAVITGASSGIGAAAARALAGADMKVVLAARRHARIAQLAAELGDAALAVETDVSDAAQVAALFETVRARFGGLDLLFNNAGLSHENSWWAAAHVARGSA